jgi:integrase
LGFQLFSTYYNAYASLQYFTKAVFTYYSLTQTSNGRIIYDEFLLKTYIFLHFLTIQNQRQINLPNMASPIATTISSDGSHHVSIIFKIEKPRNRIMLELMARAGMRVGEVLKIRPVDLQDRKITLPDPKSGKKSEVVFIPQKIADRLKDYISEKGIEPGQRVFPITYNAARVMVKKAGKLVGIDLRPHDLRRFSATYASRSGAPIEIVSKVLLRYAHLSTTQRYLGKISDTEAMKWIENLYG